jgi:flagellum-specific peptidoglycan hydrolase FlgJ
MQKQISPNISLSNTSTNWASYKQWLSEKWFEILMVVLIFHISASKDIELSVQFGANPSAFSVSHTPQHPSNTTYALPVKKEEKSFNLGKWLDTRKSAKKPAKKTAKKTSKKRQPKKVYRAQSFYNLSFIMNPTYAKRKGVPASIVNEKRQNCLAYVKKYAKIALEEQRKHGILASITLAQGLLESNAGDSRLARESLNHFGIKCRRKCRGCTCRNYNDDDIYDMFRVFENPEESYEEHSTLLNTKRYRKLKQYGNNYKKWAHGLKKAGYATDKRYAEKLICIIEALHLDRYDDL